MTTNGDDQFTFFNDELNNVCLKRMYLAARMKLYAVKRHHGFFLTTVHKVTEPVTHHRALLYGVHV